jgi:hypothetical protein
MRGYDPSNSYRVPVSGGYPGDPLHFGPQLYPGMFEVMPTILIPNAEALS